MQNRIREGRQNIVLLMMNIAIVMISVVMVICAFTAVRNLREDFSMTYREDSFYYQLDSGDFYRMVGAYHTNVQEGCQGSSALQEYYGVARYYEAASFYKAFLNTGDVRRAQREQARMEEALEQMGSWNIVQEEIHRQLGLDMVE